MQDSVRTYLSIIGRKGGKTSRRELSPVTAKKMVLIREARRAFKRFYSECFWSVAPDYRIHFEDIEWLLDGLKKHGSRDAFFKAYRIEQRLKEVESLCH